MSLVKNAQMIKTVILLALLVGLSGCGKNPATYTKSEVEALLKTNLELKEVSLDAQPEGGFTGTGKGNDGTPYKLTVVQDKKESKLSYTAQSTSDDEMKSGFIKNN